MSFVEQMCVGVSVIVISDSRGVMPFCFEKKVMNGWRRNVDVFGAKKLSLVMSMVICLILMDQNGTFGFDEWILTRS